jgi:hypothetical protein
MFFEYYSVILILQGFCLYHAYRNNNFQKWYFILIFVPLIGSIIYLYDNFYSKRNVESISEGLKKIVNSNYEIDNLERELKIADTYKNKLNLSDAYFKVGRYDDSNNLLNSCKNKLHGDDPDLLRRLIKTNYFLNNYEAVIQFANEVKNVKTFQYSEEKVMFAEAYANLNNQEKAISIFEEMNSTYSNYNSRNIYLKYLLNSNKTDLAKNLALELKKEISLLDRNDKRFNKEAINEINNTIKQMNI